MAVRIDGPKFYAWDANGHPLSGGKLYTYESGGVSVPKATYTGENTGIANTNPVILNSSGFADVYLDGTYNLVLYDASDSLIWSKDPVSSFDYSDFVGCKPVTYVSPNSFSLAGAQTDYILGRRIRFYNGSTYSYAGVSGSSYAGGVTVVTVDASVVPVNVQQACFSIITPNSSPVQLGTFSTVNEMKLYDLQSGQSVLTNAYRSPVVPYTNKGGAGYQIMTAAEFGGTPDGYGDHVLVNGNVAKLISNDVYNVMQYGAYGNNSTMTPVNDTDYFRAASAALTANSGGKLEIPNASYLVGKQIAGGAGKAYQGLNIVDIRSCTRPVIVECNNAKFKYEDGLRFGSFDPVTGNVYNPPALPFTTGSYVADWGYLFVFRYNKNVVIKNYEVDGNAANANLGGFFGDTGRQCIAYGLWAYDNESFLAENINCHHMPLDGMAIGWVGLTETSPQYPHTLINVTCEYNARQGCSWVGGNQLTAINCKFNYQGRGAFGSSPGAGLDIEASNSICRNGLFENCEFAHNNGRGMVADSGDSNGVKFSRCKFVGTYNHAIWPRKPNFVFEDCLIVGQYVNSYNATDGSATKYIRCTFSDEIKYASTLFGLGGIGSNLSATSANVNVLYRDCTINTTRSRPGRYDSAKLDNCVFNLSAGTEVVNNKDYVIHFGGAKINDVTINENITVNPPADGYYVNQGSLTTKATGRNVINSISANNKVKWFSWSPGSGGYEGYLGENAKEDLPFNRLAVGIGVPANLGTASVSNFASTFWGTGIPTVGTYRRGDRVFNSAPAVGSPKSWTCTVTGTPGTWESEGNL